MCFYCDIIFLICFLLNVQSIVDWENGPQQINRVITRNNLSREKNIFFPVQVDQRK